MKKVLCETKFLRLCERDGWSYCERANASGVVVMIAVTPSGHLLLVEQHRNPVERRCIELPAGLVGDEPGAKDEDLGVAAGRELLEETGYEPKRMKRVCGGPVSAGMSSEVLTFFLCTGLVKKHAGGGVEGENIVVHEVALEKVAAWLARKEKAGFLIDPKVFSGLYFAERGGAVKTAPKPRKAAAPSRRAKKPAAKRATSKR